MNAKHLFHDCFEALTMLFNIQNCLDDVAKRCRKIIFLKQLIGFMIRESHLVEKLKLSFR